MIIELRKRMRRVIGKSSIKMNRRRDRFPDTVRWIGIILPPHLSSRVMTDTSISKKVATKWRWKTTIMLQIKCTLLPRLIGKKKPDLNIRGTGLNQLASRLMVTLERKVLKLIQVKMTLEVGPNTMERAMMKRVTLLVPTLEKINSNTINKWGQIRRWDRMTWWTIASIRELSVQLIHQVLVTLMVKEMDQDQELVKLKWASVDHLSRVKDIVRRIASKVASEDIQEWEVATMFQSQ